MEITNLLMTCYKVVSTSPAKANFEIVLLPAGVKNVFFSNIKQLLNWINALITPPILSEFVLSAGLRKDVIIGSLMT